MSLIGKMGESIGGVAFGIGAVFAAPLLAKMARPAAKELIKGGLYLSEKTKEYIAESSEEFADLVAEAQAEMEESSKQASDGKSSQD